MPSDSQEPENYSISEMMDRLKERSTEQSSNGELVTRADGTQAIRVRSRKRRSHQPQREMEKRKRRNHALQLAGGLLVLFFLGLTMVAVLLYMNGGGYRNKILTNLTHATGAETTVSQFRMTPVGASASELMMSWPESSVVKKMNFYQVGAKLRVNSFLGQSWWGEEVTAASGMIELGMPSGQTAGAVTDGDSLFNFKRFRSTSTSISLGKDPQTAVTVTGSEVSLYPAGKSGHAELRMNRGKVRLGKNFPELDLDRALIGLSSQGANVSIMRLRAPDTLLGYVELSGPIASIGENQTTNLKLKASGIPLASVVGEDVGRFLSGTIDSRDLPDTNFVTFQPDTPDSHRLEIAFQGGAGNRLTLSQFPFLTRLAMILDDRSYKQAVLDVGSSGILRYHVGEVSLEDLKFEVRSRLAVRGNLVIAPDRTLSGKLQVGLPAMVASGHRALDATFGPLKSEMRWIDLAISGTTAIPQDDFDKRMAAAESGGARPAGTSADGGSAADAFRELTQPR